MEPCAQTAWGDTTVSASQASLESTVRKVRDVKDPTPSWWGTHVVKNVNSEEASPPFSVFLSVCDCRSDSVYVGQDQGLQSVL